jgi:hypothetical protein
VSVMGCRLIWRLTQGSRMICGIWRSGFGLALRAKVILLCGSENEKHCLPQAIKALAASYCVKVFSLTHSCDI